MVQNYHQIKSVMLNSVYTVVDALLSSLKVEIGSFEYSCLGILNKNQTVKQSVDRATSYYRQLDKKKPNIQFP